MSTIPNAITALRLLFGLGAAVVQAMGFRSETIHALVLTLFCLSVVLDYWDGYVARMMGSASILGKHFDRAADQLALWGNLVVLVHQDTIHPILLILVLAREVLTCEIWNYGDILGNPINVYRALHLRYLFQIAAVASGLLAPLAGPSALWFHPLPNLLLVLSLMVGGVTLGLCLKTNAQFLKRQN
jgi:CDP-diacylglycerol---glycerol-3-phosphate 3-phosphatidyltransferase